MKIINITEAQYKKLLEANFENSAPNFNGKQQEYNDSETTVTSNVTDLSGNLKRGKPVSSDDLADTMSVQNYWYQSPRNGNIK